MSNNSGIFSSTCADGDFISRFEQIVVDDGLMDFKLEGLEEALLADGLEVFGSFDEGLLVVAGGADEFRHDFLLYNVMIIIKDSIQ